MYQYFLLVVFMWASVASAQEQAAVPKKKGSNRLYPSYATQHYYDKNSVKYEGLAPENHIHPKNTDGHSFGLQYERVTRYGLIYGAGVYYGIRRYDIVVQQDFSGFDPEAVNTLKGYYSYERYPVAVNFCGIRLNAGYRMAINTKWAAVIKLGVGDKRFFDGPWQRYETIVEYTSDDGHSFKSIGTSYTEMKFGRPGVLKGRGGIFHTKYFPEILWYYECYLGVERDFKTSWVKNLSLGIEANRNMTIQGYPPGMTIWSSPTINKLLQSKDEFIDRNLSLGLRIGVGLWK